MAAVTARIGRVKDLQMAWRFGGRIERELALFVISAPAVVVGAFVLANAYLLLAHAASPALLQIDLVLIMAASSWYFFQPAITAPMYSNAYYREAIRQRWLSPLQCDYAAEIVRYRETIGVNENRPQHLQWARALAIVYDAGVCGSGVFALTLFPILGSWTWLAFAGSYVPIVLILWRAFWRQMRREGDLAKQMGFRMREIGAQMLLAMRKERDARRPPP